MLMQNSKEYKEHLIMLYMLSDKVYSLLQDCISSQVLVICLLTLTVILCRNVITLVTIFEAYILVYTTRHEM